MSRNETMKDWNGSIAVSGAEAQNNRLDNASLTLLLRAAVGKRVSQLQSANPDMSEEEAEDKAAEALLESLCGERINIRSRAEVEVWCERFRVAAPR